MTTANQTHANLTTAEYDAALSIFDVPCTDEDGNAEVLSVVITASSVGYGYDINVYQGGEIVDHDTAHTIDEAGAVASDFVDEIRKQDKEMRYTRIQNHRIHGRECLMGAAEEMTGEDAQAAELLALLIGAGRGPVALAALRRIALK